MPLSRVTFNSQLIRRVTTVNGATWVGQAGRHGPLHWFILNRDASSSARLISRSSMHMQKHGGHRH